MEINDLLIMLDEPRVIKKIKSLMFNKVYAKDKVEENSNVNPEVYYLQQENKRLIEDNTEMAGLIKKLKALITGKDEKISENSSQFVMLESKVTELKRQLEQKETDFNQLNLKINNLEDALGRTKSELDNYCISFGEDIKVADIYNSLSELTKNSLSGIFKSTTQSGLVACGIQEKNIGNLWEYAKNEVVNRNNPDTSMIIELFNILFSRFILAFPMYEFQSVSVGESFETQLHIKHNSSHNVSGTIEHVLLFGYINTKTEKVIKQSVVRI